MVRSENVGDTSITGRGSGSPEKTTVDCHGTMAKYGTEFVAVTVETVCRWGTDAETVIGEDVDHGAERHDIASHNGRLRHTCDSK